MRSNDHFEPNHHAGHGAVAPRSSEAPASAYPGYDHAEEHLHAGGFDFWAAFKVISNRRWLILAIVVFGVAAAGLSTLRVDPLYRSSATIEIHRQETQILDTSSVEPVVVADAEYMATQYALLTSRSLAERVAETLDLPADARYADQSLDRDARLNEAAEDILDGLSVSPVARSRVINVQFVSPHPQEAARIANAVVENFIEANLERRYNTTAYARQFLEERLTTTRTTLEESERRLVEYAQQQGILDLGDDGGAAPSLDASSLMALNRELTEAQSARIDAEQRYQEALDSPITREMLESETLRTLRSRRADLVAQYQEMLGRFKPDYPDMQELQARIDSVDEEIEQERQAILASLESEYRAAQAREQSLQERVDALRGDVQDLRNRSIQYTILQREVDTNRAQYDALLQRLKEVSIASGIGSSQVSIVDRAQVSPRPFEPNLKRTLLRGFILSVAAALGLAFALDYIDDTIKTPEDVRRKLGLASIGVVPKVSTRDPITMSLNDPKSSISEAFFSVRTALQFTTSSGAPRTLLVTSTRPSEGKTSTTIALSMALAKVGQRVLIIDADMRQPSFVADAGASIGLSGLLTRDALLSEQIVSSSKAGLSLLPAGVVPPNPAELLSSPRLGMLLRQAQKMYDIVVVDSPPVANFADAPLLGSVCEGALVVIQSGSIRRPTAQRTISRLMESKTNVLGAVLTKFDVRKDGRDYGYAYYHYGNKGGYGYSDRALSDENRARRKIKFFRDEDGGSRDDDAGFDDASIS